MVSDRAVIFHICISCDKTFLWYQGQGICQGQGLMSTCQGLILKKMAIVGAFLFTNTSCFQIFVRHSTKNKCIMFVKRLMLTGIVYTLVMVGLLNISVVLTEEAKVMVESTENPDGTVTGTLLGTHKSVETCMHCL